MSTFEKKMRIEYLNEQEILKTRRSLIDCTAQQRQKLSSKDRKYLQKKYLLDAYVAKVLGMPEKDCPEELIRAKRSALLIQRVQRGKIIPPELTNNAKPGRPSVTHCAAGHEYTPENMVGGKKFCRICRNIRNKAKRKDAKINSILGSKEKVNADTIEKIYNSKAESNGVGETITVHIRGNKEGIVYGFSGSMQWTALCNRWQKHCWNCEPDCQLDKI